MNGHVLSPGNITWDLGPKNDIRTAAKNPLLNELRKVYTILFI